MNKITISVLIALSLVAVSCKDTITEVITPLTTEQKEFAEVIEHSEIHFASGPFEIVTGSNEAANKEHTCYKLVPTASTGMVSYTVALDSGETVADRLLFVNKTGITVELKDAKGAEIHSHASDFTGISAKEIKQGFEFHDLTAGVYTVEFSNLAVGDTVKFLIEEGGHEHDH